jgi:hypothetical protein
MSVALRTISAEKELREAGDSYGVFRGDQFLGWCTRGS